jgi:hypothetical protein
MSNDDPAGSAQESLSIELNDFVTGVQYPHPFDELAVALCASAARNVNILSPTLDHRVFDNPELVAALAALARDSRQTQVRILISDSRQIVARGHRLVQLARRLTSSVHIQKLAEHPDWNGETVITRDRDGVLYKPGGSDHEGFYQPNSRWSAQKHLELFEELWRHSAADVELRALSL